MLLDLQKQMLARAHAEDPELIIVIFGTALNLGDLDTAEHIVAEYADKYDAEMQVAMRGALAELVAEMNEHFAPQTVH